MRKDRGASLFAICPLDGRYASRCAALRELFSEAALIKHRVLVEVRYLDALTGFLGVGDITPAERRGLLNWAGSLSLQDLDRVKSIEAETRHDVKAVEYFFRDRLKAMSLARLSPWIHWGLTSEDVDNLAYGLMLRQAKDEVLLPAQIRLVRTLLDLAQRYAGSVMLARTHGQIAVPTTVGKEFVVFASRAAYFLEKMIPFPFGGKLSGAVGNLNAHYQVYPDQDWAEFSRSFVEGLGLEPTAITTQIEPCARLGHFLDLTRQLNGVWLDLARDCWLYIALGSFRQKPTQGVVGSSTMPHKVNPIDFENAEGNLQVANCLLHLLADNLPVSRLQRDLSGKTVKRNLGMALGYGLVAAQSLSRGLSKIVPDQSFLEEQVKAHPEVLAEAVQLLLRSQGEVEAFEEMQAKVRGREVEWEQVVRGLDQGAREIVENWQPEKYTGLAAKLTRQEIERVEKMLDIQQAGGEGTCPT